MEDVIYYRWVLIDNQETCYCCVVKLFEGFFKSQEDVKEFYKCEACFDEHLFRVEKLEFSATPEWIVRKTGELVG